MSNRIRHFAAAFATAGLALTLALPARADRMTDLSNAPSSVPMIFDVLVMRPIGLLATVMGTVFYVVPVAPIMALTRPTEIAKPMGPLIGAPARFTFKDPIGHHPQQF
jgi:hypothetical protein